jgi:hypothetical protein
MSASRVEAATTAAVTDKQVGRRRFTFRSLNRGGVAINEKGGVGAPQLETIFGKDIAMAGEDSREKLCCW